MDLNLRDKVVMIVGATRGLGRACAEVFASEGCHLALISRSEDSLNQMADEVGDEHGVDVETHASDFTHVDKVDRVVSQIFARYGRIDALVNTIGAFSRNPEGSPVGADELWQDAFQSILMASVRSCRAVAPFMQAQGGGAIVNTSALSVRHYSPAIAHYSAMKAALAHFTKNLAIYYSKDKIRANILLPGWIWSEQVQETYQQYLQMPDMQGKSFEDIFHRMNEDAHRATYSGRPGQPLEYAKVAAFLCSDAASYVNGAWMNVDGGSMF